MTRLPLYWADPAFRAALYKLLSFSDEELAKLRHLTAESFELRESKGLSVDLNEDQLRLVGAALETMYLESRAIGSPARVIETLQESTGQNVSYASEIRSFLESSEKQSALIDLLSERPDYERRLERRVAQEAALPSLERLNFFLDYRVIEDGSQEIPGKLVPVIVARLTLDEPIQGSDAVTFQISDERLLYMTQEIQRIRALIQTMQKNLSNLLY